MLEIRPLRNNEIEQALDLFSQIVAEDRWLGTELGFDRTLRAARLRDHIEDDRYLCLAAFEDGVLAGQCNVHPDETHGYSLGIGVERDRRGRGIGRALMQRAEMWACGRGISELFLLVFAHNAAARALYAGLGYEERAFYAGDVVRKNGDVFDTILMSKKLPNAER